MEDRKEIQEKKDREESENVVESSQMEKEIGPKSKQDEEANAKKTESATSKQNENVELSEFENEKMEQDEGTESDDFKSAESQQDESPESKQDESAESDEFVSAELEQTESKITEETKKDPRKIDLAVQIPQEKTYFEEKKLPYIFLRPRNAALKHPIFSSPFAQQIATKAFGPLKPPWFTSLNSSELSLFKTILTHVERGRQGRINFDHFLTALQSFDPTITKSEVIGILESMEVSEFEELDFGRFLFFLAFGIEKVDDDDKVPKNLTARQSRIMSAIANYVSITSLKDIENYYKLNTRRRSSILRHHMENVRLQSLSEAQMERKQHKLNQQMAPMRAITTSPYAHPVPVVKRFSKSKVFLDWMKSKSSIPIKDSKVLGRTPSKPFVPEDENAKLQREKFDAAAKDIIYKMNFGRIPIPELKFPHSITKQIRKGFTVEIKDYIMRKAFDTKEEFRNSLKKSAVLYSKAALVQILRQGFPTEEDKKHFIEVYRKYLPLHEDEIKLVSLWIQPYGYEKYDTDQSLDASKYAFGTKISTS